jgi:siroheme synthase
VVIYMGVSTAGRIAARLIAAGRSPSTPALVVFRASRPDERRIPTRLGDLAEAAASDTGPALLVVGEAMSAALASLAPTPGLREERA